MYLKPHLPTRLLSLLGATAALLIGSGYAAPGIATASTRWSWSTAPTPASPPALEYASAAYDADSSTVVLFGGVTANGTLNDTTWLWDGHSWTAPSTPEPPARQAAVMAFDPVLHQLILFGGRDQNGNLLSDTWAWNGAWWYQITATTAAPPARQAAAMAYDGHGQLVLFGGIGNPPPPDTSTTTAPSTTTTTTTTTASTTTNAPDLPARAAPSIPAAAPGTDPSSAARGSNRVLASQAATATAATAGTDLSDTWLWTATGWVPSSTGGPPARSDALLVTDSSDATAVLFGGQDSAQGAPPAVLADTWVWNGSGWAEAHPTKSPPGRLDAAGAYDAAGGGPVLMGGLGSSGALSDTWMWSGGTWSELSVSGDPPARQTAAAAYDAATSDLVVYGGRDTQGEALDDTGLLEFAGSTVSPSTTVAGVAPTPATVPPGGSPTVSTTTGARPGISAVAGGSGSTPATTTGPPVPVAGSPPVELQASGARLRPAGPVWLSGSGFAPGALITLTFHSTPDRLGQVTAGRNGTFRVLVTVPGWAAVGEHRFVAEGMAASGRLIDAQTTVMVLGRGPRAAPWSTRLAMVGLAVGIPAATYLAMAAVAARRRRPAGLPGLKGPGSDRRSLS
ncbi:MAG: hypothetical protein KGQ66_11410 [Acidobacteriota bacterium]|nr:hypothetical protein [Acidobacteriota bacterium]